MRLVHTPFIAACLLLGFSSVLMAQTTGTSAPETAVHAGSKMHAAMHARQTQRLTDLKAKLKLEPAQETAWLGFTQAMQMPSPSGIRPDRVALEKLNTPERLDLLQAHKAQRDALMNKRTDATKSFYAILNSDQKKIFDGETARFMNRMTDPVRHAKQDGHHGPHH